MFTLGIHYLNGWAMATDQADRESPEWPPHPDRVFMALVSAHFETDGDADERDALNWLEKQPPPTVIATGAYRRSKVTSYVPVNDDSSPLDKKNLKPRMASGSLPIGRERKARCFPVAIPVEPLVFLAWEDPPPTKRLLAAFGRLVSKVAALGHSASLVHMWLAAENEMKENRRFDENARRLQPVEASASRYRLRVWGPGRLRYLQDRFDAKVRPTSALWQGYAEARQEERPQPEIVGSRFDSDLIVLRQSAGRRFGLSSTLLLTKVLRDTLMSHCSRQPPPEWLSGHRADGRPGEREYGHLAVFPLPHVGRLHADGHLLGLAISIPRDVSRNELYSCLGDLFFDENQWPKRIKLTLGRLGECVLEIDEGSSPRVALNPATWLKPSRTWATVTPLALDRHPKPRDSEAAIAEIVNRSCLRVGLPSPQTIIPETVSRFVGAPTSREMPRITRKNDGSPVCQTHAKITFPCEVQGPVLLGTGRYRGYGLCRPINPAEVRA